MLEILLWSGGILAACFAFVVFRGAPYVPTRKAQIHQAFDELYPLSADDVVVDVGSGDGVVLREVARRGARAIGYELNPILVGISRWLGRTFPGHISVRWKDFWGQTLPAEVTVVYAFLEDRDIGKMQKFLERQAVGRVKPLYFISYGFELPNQLAIKRVGALFLYKFVGIDKTNERLKK